MVDVKTISVNDLKPNNWNPNKMSSKKYAALVRNIKKHGMIQNIIVNKDNIISDGFHRWRAAKEAGIKEIICFVAETTDEESKLMTLSFNNLRGINDEKELKKLVEELMENVDLDAIIKETAFDSKYLEDLISAGDDLDKIANELSDDDKPHVETKPRNKNMFSRISFDIPKDKVETINRAIQETDKETKETALIHLCEFYIAHRGNLEPPRRD